MLTSDTSRALSLHSPPSLVDMMGAVDMADVVGTADTVGGGQWARWMWEFGKIKGNLEAGKTDCIVVIKQQIELFFF